MVTFYNWRDYQELDFTLASESLHEGTGHHELFRGQFRYTAAAARFGALDLAQFVQIQPQHFDAVPHIANVVLFVGRVEREKRSQRERVRKEPNYLLVVVAKQRTVPENNNASKRTQSTVTKVLNHFAKQYQQRRKLTFSFCE